MASAFSRLRGDVEDDLDAQVAKLTNELASLKKAMASRDVDAYGDAREAASDAYGDLHDRLVRAMPSVRRHARAAERAARDNPGMTAALVGLAVAGLLVTLMARR